MQLILIHAITTNQEEDQLNKRSKEISTLIEEQYKLGSIKLPYLKISLKILIEKNEMIRILDQQGQEIFNISEDFPDLQSSKLEYGFHRIKEDNEDFLMLKEPLIVETFKGSLEIGQSVETFEEFMERVFWVLLAGTILSLILSIIGGQLLARKFLAPLAVMTQTMRKIETSISKSEYPL